MGGSDGGRGEPLTPHKTRRSSPSQASEKLMDKQELRNGAQVRRRSGRESGFFFFKPKNEEKVFPF